MAQNGKASMSPLFLGATQDSKSNLCTSFAFRILIWLNPSFNPTNTNSFWDPVSRCAKCLYRLVSILCSRVSRLSWKAPRLQMRNFPEAWMANNGAEIEPKLRQDVRRTCFFQVGQGRVFAAMCHAEPCRVSEKDQTCQVCTFIAD